MNLENLEHALKNVCLAKKIKLNKIQEVNIGKYCVINASVFTHKSNLEKINLIFDQQLSINVSIN